MFEFLKKIFGSKPKVEERIEPVLVTPEPLVQPVVEESKATVVTEPVKESTPEEIVTNTIAETVVEKKKTKSSKKPTKSKNIEPASPVDTAWPFPEPAKKTKSKKQK
jgi:hypothetical protein